MVPSDACYYSFFVCHSVAQRRNLLFSRPQFRYPPHMPQREYILDVDILSDRSRTIYIGMTNYIVLRVA